MTRQANNESEFTEFSLWIRSVSVLDAKKHKYAASDVDYMWTNYATGEWMYIEEKRKKARPSYSQNKIFNVMDECARTDDNYKGFWILRFENTNPMDGNTWINRLGSDKDFLARPEDVIRFMSFKTWEPPRGCGDLVDLKEEIIASRYN